MEAKCDLNTFSAGIVAGSAGTSKTTGPRTDSYSSKNVRTLNSRMNFLTYVVSQGGDVRLLRVIQFTYGIHSVIENI